MDGVDIDGVDIIRKNGGDELVRIGEHDYPVVVNKHWRT
jgi:hypothetical protein